MNVAVLHHPIVLAGVWCSPTVSGTRPPPCAGFTLTAIDNYRAIMFGGLDGQQWSMQKGLKVKQTYLINFETIVYNINTIIIIIVNVHTCLGNN